MWLNAKPDPGVNSIRLCGLVHVFSHRELNPCSSLNSYELMAEPADAKSAIPLRSLHFCRIDRRVSRSFLMKEVPVFAQTYPAEPLFLKWRSLDSARVPIENIEHYDRIALFSDHFVLIQHPPLGYRGTTKW
jgi:hypothetical protein